MRRRIQQHPQKGILILGTVLLLGLMTGSHPGFAFWRTESPIFSVSFESFAEIDGLGGNYTGISLEPGREGNAVLVDNQDVLTFPAAGRIDPQKGTVRFWLSPTWDGDATTEPHYFFDWRTDHARFRIFTWYASGSGKHYLTFRYNDGNGHDREASTAGDEPNQVMAWKAGSWHDIIAFWDFTVADPFMGLVVDGVVYYRQDDGWQVTETPETMWIGVDSYEYVQGDARMDELRIDDESLWDPSDLIGSYQRITCGNGRWDVHETHATCPEDAPILDPTIHPQEDVLFFATAPFEAVYEGTVPPASAITDTFTYRAARDEFETLFFNIYTRIDLDDASLQVSDFIGPQGAVLPASSMQLRVVHNWWQAGVGPLKDDYPHYVPELLLYDDTIDLENQTWDYDTLPDMPPLDHARVDMPAYTAKQFALILPIPKTTPAGHYTATLTLSAPALSNVITSTISLELDPFSLLDSGKTVVIYHPADIDHPDSNYYVPMARYQAQLADIKNHGFNGTLIYGRAPGDNISLKIQKNREAGLTRRVILNEYDDEAVTLLQDQGYEPYFYGIDEPYRGNYAYMNDHIQRSMTIHQGGGKVTTAINKEGEEKLKDCQDPIYQDFPPGTCEPLDMANLNIQLSLDYLHALIDGTAVKQDYETYYWQIMQEDPRVNRFLAGFFLWRTGLDGIFPYVYQDVRHNPYDDFDTWSSINPYRDHLVTYPSQQGPVPTIQWEALREGLDDVRYLRTWRFYQTLAQEIDANAAAASAQTVNAILARYNRYDAMKTIPLAQYTQDRQRIAQEIVTMKSLVDAVTPDPLWLTGRVGWDVNHDGQLTPDEPGMANVQLLLADSTQSSDPLRAQATTDQTTLTDSQGVYTFTHLAPGPYLLSLAPANFASGGPLAGWPADTVPPQSFTLDETQGARQTAAPFTLEKQTSYLLTKHLNTPDPIRPGQPISFTIHITNTGETWLATLPLQDTYNTGYLTYGYGGQYAQPDSDDHDDDGAIDWSDALGGNPLAPDQSTSVVITFTARADTTQLADGKTRNVVRAHDGTADPDGPSGPLGAQEPLPERSDDAQVAIVKPTGVVLGSFRATPRDAGVDLRWRTLNESQIAGFRLLRAVDVRGRLTVPREIAFIPARHSGMAQGQRYQVWDDQVRAGARYRYWLEVVRIDGSTYRLPPRSVWIMRISPLS